MIIIIFVFKGVENMLLHTAGGIAAVPITKT